MTRYARSPLCTDSNKGLAAGSLHNLDSFCTGGGLVWNKDVGVFYEESGMHTQDDESLTKQTLSMSQQQEVSSAFSTLSLNGAGRICCKQGGRQGG